MPTNTTGLSATFVELLTGPDENLRNHAVIDLSIREGVPGTAAALMPLLANKEYARHAVEALGKLGVEALPAASTIRRFADEAERAGATWRRLQALVALAGITGERAEVLGVVRRFLATGTDKEARLAAGVLKDLGAAADLVPEWRSGWGRETAPSWLTILGVLEDLGAAAEPALAGDRVPVRQRRPQRQQARRPDDGGDPEARRRGFAAVDGDGCLEAIADKLVLPP